jgi:hypothetical protein
MVGVGNLPTPAALRADVADARLACADTCQWPESLPVHATGARRPRHGAVRLLERDKPRQRFLSGSHRPVRGGETRIKKTQMVFSTLFIDNNNFKLLVRMINMLPKKTSEHELGVACGCMRTCPPRCVRSL